MEFGKTFHYFINLMNLACDLRLVVFPLKKVVFFKEISTFAYVFFSVVGGIFTFCR